jgi:hypothetical protein
VKRNRLRSSPGPRSNTRDRRIAHQRAVPAPADGQLPMSIDFSALNQVTLDCGRWSEFFPTFLAAFSGRFALGIASAEARAVLAIAPTPAAAAKLSVGRIAAALRRAGRSRGID